MKKQKTKTKSVAQLIWFCYADKRCEVYQFHIWNVGASAPMPPSAPKKTTIVNIYPKPNPNIKP